MSRGHIPPLVRSNRLANCWILSNSSYTRCIRELTYVKKYVGQTNICVYENLFNSSETHQIWRVRHLAREKCRRMCSSIAEATKNIKVNDKLNLGFDTSESFYIMYMTTGATQVIDKMEMNRRTWLKTVRRTLRSYHFDTIISFRNSLNGSPQTRATSCSGDIDWWSIQQRELKFAFLPQLYIHSINNLSWVQVKYRMNSGPSNTDIRSALIFFISFLITYFLGVLSTFTYLHHGLETEIF